MMKKIIAAVLSVVMCFSCACAASAFSLSDLFGGSSNPDIDYSGILDSDEFKELLESDGVIDISGLVQSVLDGLDLSSMSGFQVIAVIQSVIDYIVEAIEQVNLNANVFAPNPIDIFNNLFVGKGPLDYQPFQDEDDDDDNDDGDKEFLPGDVNFDGQITAADARLILRRSARLIIFSDLQDMLADVDGDGKITAKDARIVLRISAGLPIDEDDDGGFSIEDTENVENP